MNIDEMESAVRDARQKIRDADVAVGRMAGMCAGRLRAAGVSGTYLEQLKRELRDFNIHTGNWTTRK